MIFRRICATVALALVALLAVPPSGAAAALPTVWNEASCATGAITHHATVHGHQGRAYLVLAGWMRACGEPVPGANVGIMEYRKSIAQLYDVVSGRAVLPYGRFAATVPLDSVMLRDGEDLGLIQAVCVARGYEAPVACLGVERSRSGRVRAVVPISPRDQRVTSVPVFRAPDMAPWPHCGNCV